jgi:hypothetical protein
LDEESGDLQDPQDDNHYVLEALINQQWVSLTPLHHFEADTLALPQIESNLDTVSRRICRAFDVLISFSVVLPWLIFFQSMKQIRAEFSKNLKQIRTEISESLKQIRTEYVLALT